MHQTTPHRLCISWGNLDPLAVLRLARTSATSRGHLTICTCIFAYTMFWQEIPRRAGDALLSFTGRGVVEEEISTEADSRLRYLGELRLAQVGGNEGEQMDRLVDQGFYFWPGLIGLWEFLHALLNGVCSSSRGRPIESDRSGRCGNKRTLPSYRTVLCWDFSIGTIVAA